MRRIITALLLSLLPLFSLVLFAADQSIYLSGLLIQPSQTASRFTFILNEKTTGQVKYFSNPKRLEIEFKNTHKNFDMQNVSLGGGNVRAIDSKELGKNKLRFIFYVRSAAQWKLEFLPEEQGSGVRLQLTIITNEPLPPRSSSQPSSRLPSHAPSQMPLQKSSPIFLPRPSQAPTQKSKVIKSLTQSSSNLLKTFIVVIDAGHGGKDPGASGKNGAKEKNVVLTIAKRLANKLNALPHVHAVLTRNGDYFVPLRKRLKLAREKKAYLFVAIHADAYFEKDATGVSVYALSEHGATNEAARWLAQRENYSELGGVELDALTDRDPILRSVLVDLAQTTTMKDSVRLGNKVLNELQQVSSLHYQHVERAPFVVLKSPDIPSILVETGFITNPREENRLTNAAYQERLASALADGIDQYVQQYAGKGE
jgi:N-acetylmuramoyl-L-alanine amidase